MRIRGFVLAVASLAVVAASQAPAASVDAVQSPVVAARNAWIQAYANGDGAKLAAMISDDFAITASNGDLSDRPAFLARFAKGPMGLTMTPSDTRVALHGGAAVVTGKVLEKRGANMLEFQVTDTLVRRGNRWLLAASHWTRTGGELAEISLAPAALDRLTGAYRTPRGVVLTVSRRGNRLLVTEPSGASSEFAMVSERMMMSPASKVRWLFVAEPTGEVRHAVIANQTVLTPVDRMESSAPR